VVFDLNDTPQRHRYFLLSPDEYGGHRMVFDFYAQSQENKSTATPEKVADTASVQTPAQGGSEVAAAAPPPAPREPEPAPPVQAEPVTETSTQALATNGNWSATWEHELAYRRGGLQKFESIIQPRFDSSLAPGLDLTAIVRLRGDTEGLLGPSSDRPNNYSAVNGPLAADEHYSFELRELYVDFSLGDSAWRVGKQQIVWGQADGIKVLDVVNPQSYREFILDDFDDSRIPLWSVSGEFYLGQDTALQLVWLPDTTYHELAEPGSPFAFSSPRLVPPMPPGDGPLPEPDIDTPDDPLQDSDVGLRLSSFVNGWDLSLNYLYHYQDFPVLYLDYGNSAVNPVYERNHLLGSEFSTSFGDSTFRGELAYNSHTFHGAKFPVPQGIVESAEVSGVFALDHALNADHLISLQWFYSYLTDHDENMYRDEFEQVITSLWQSEFANASWQFRLIGLYSIDDGDSLVQLKLRYWILSNLELWVGADILSGTNSGLFGQFDEEDRILVGFEYGF
jgi:hypothetical protein